MIVDLLNTWDDLNKLEDSVAKATLTCHANREKLYQSDYQRSNTVKNCIKAGHESTLEHMCLQFDVQFISRACLQELSRHRLMSLSVESTRHTLKKQIFNDYWITEAYNHIPPQCKKIFDDDIAFLREKSKTLDNDKLKYFLREYWPTSLVLTVNARELRHIIKLRSNPAALKEFQDLARNMYREIPDEFKYIFEDCLYKENEVKE